MKLAVIDANYNDRIFSGLAATWLRWELEQAGVKESTPEEADVLLVTVSSQQGIKAVKRELRRAKNNRAKVVLGGGGCYAPAVFGELADVICVGEGARFVRTLLRMGYGAACSLPEAWIPGDTRMVDPGREFPWEIPPLMNTDGFVRLFGSRGCRYRCLFCQTGWEAPYRVNPDMGGVCRLAQRLTREGRQVAIVTNDGAEEHIRLAGRQEFISVRVDNLKRIMPLSRAVTKSVRLGVEGVSERLRKAVGKPVGNEDLLRLSFDLLGAGVGVRWFFIPGLPGETAGDYDELRYLVSNLKRLPKGAVMMNFHAFIPQPATPLSIFPLRDEYWEPFDEFRRWFFHGPGFTRRVQIVAPARYQGRLDRAMESMAATEDELRRGWWEADNPNWRVRYLAAPDRLRKIARVYARHTGAT